MSAIGSESGVLSLHNLSFEAQGSLAVSPVKALMNLTTKITGIAKHPSAQLLAFASSEVYNFTILTRDKYYFYIIHICFFYQINL